MLPQDLHGDRALAGDHIRIVERVDEGQPMLGLQLGRVVVGVRVAVACQYHLAAQSLDGIDLDLRRGRGHHDHRTRTQLAGAQRDALGLSLIHI